MKRKIDWFLPGLLCAVALAWLFPNPGAPGGWMQPQILTKIGIALIFFPARRGTFVCQSQSRSFALAAASHRAKLHVFIFPHRRLCLAANFRQIFSARFAIRILLSVRAAFDGFLISRHDRSGARQRAGRRFQRHLVQLNRHFHHARCGLV